MNDGEYALDPTMMRTRDVTCYSCGHKEAVYFMTTDENETKIIKVFICGKLNDLG